MTIACVDVIALPLQIVLRAHPEWSEDPTVVVEDERPLAKIVWANRAARRVRITRGTKLSEAKAFSATLHAEVVPEHEVTRAIDALFDRLLTFSPHVEPVLLQPGLFWIDASGLTPLFGDLERWARSVCEALRAERFVSSVVVGFSRGGTLAIARTGEGPVVLESAREEQQRAARVPLARLDVPSALVEQLALLGIRTVGELLALPGTQLKVRYGAEAARLHEFLSGRAWSPLLPRVPEPPLTVELEVEPPDDDHGRLLFGLKGLLHRVTSQLEAEQHAITALQLCLSIERHAPHTERIEAAAPTLDVAQIIDLVRLRLSSLSLPGKTERMQVTVEHVRVYARQLGLYRGESQGASRQRDLEAGARALARLRASFGPHAVTSAKLRDEHLPEARFGYEPVSEVRAPVLKLSEAGPAEDKSSTPLVRRLYPTPLPLPWPSGPSFARAARGDEPYSAAPGAVAASAISAASGPDRISGQWWSGSEHKRDYYYVETSTGEVLWVFYDEHKKRWLLHGSVE